jgi:hypothetical protein
MALLRARRKPPPGRVYAPAVVPGYGQYVVEKARKRAGQWNARHDRSEPQTQQTGRSERLPYNPHGDYKHPRRPNRPRWD